MSAGAEAAARHPGGARRVAILLRALLSGHGSSDSFLAALLVPAVLTAALAALVRTELAGFGYALVFLTLCGLFVAIPLLGELARLLRADPASEFVGTQPIADREIRAARSLHLCVALCALAAGPLVPAALLAPESFGALARAGLLASGLGLAVFLAAVLLAAQALLAGRAEGLFVLLQTALVACVFLGMILGARHVGLLAGIDGLDAAGSLALLPSAWFAAPFGASPSVVPAVACGVLSGLLVLVLPRPRIPRRRRRCGPVELLLAPARALATRLWVARDERGPFDLVYDALPREREVVLRSYPMLGIPLALLFAASTGEEAGGRTGLVALLLFTPGIYLPVLLAHVPASESHEARWILATSPASRGAIANGAIKALAVRFLLPLYVILFLVAWNGTDLALAARLSVPGALVSLLVLRRLYVDPAGDLPLSVPPDRVRTGLDRSGELLVLAIGLTLVAVAASALLGPARAAVAAAALVAVEALAGRALRRRLG